MPSHRDETTTFIGKVSFRGNDRVFGIKTKDRRQHMYVIGKTGVGKTALLKNLALQDIRAGRGIGIIDPHGEFVEEVLEQIPEERAKDVIYFNPVDSDFPIGFNILEVHDLKYKHLVVSDLLGIFTKIWANVWSARMEYILQNCILALLDTPGTTLLGIPRLLVDKDYRQSIVANVKDPVVKSFWVHEYETWRDQFRNEAIVPVQNKVGQFLNTGFIRNIVGQPKSTLNIPDIMNEGKILLVNVSKGKVGEDNSALLGAMIITKIQLAAMERVRISEEDRVDFYLYVDEFQNFATDSFASILSEARKYRLNLILAHQYIGQLVTDVSTKVRDAVFGNVGSMITFRVGATDAEFLENEFTPEFLMQDLLSLPNHHIYLKLMVDGVTSRPFSGVTLPPLQFETDPTVKEKILLMSRERYAKPRKEVEDRITQWSSMIGEGAGSGGGGEGGSAAASAGPTALIETPCWNCGKTATVPFKPDGKRPVYCMDCLKKIEAGTLIPLPERMPRVGNARFGGSLEGIGIEFDGTASTGSEKPREPRQSGGGEYRGGGPDAGRPRFNRPQGSESRPPSSMPMQRRSPGDRPPMRREAPAPGLRSRPVVRMPQSRQSLSLSSLKPKESAQEAGDTGVPRQERSSAASRPQRMAPDTSALRKVLEEALKKDSSKPAVDGERMKKEEGEMKPGEAIQIK